MNLGLFVFLGGGLGALLRFFLSQLVFSMTHKLWPGTFVVNLLGCIIFCLFVKFAPGSDQRLVTFLQVGFLGALTTFSTFNYELLILLKNGQGMTALMVLLLNVLSGILVGAWILR